MLQLPIDEIIPLIVIRLSKIIVFLCTSLCDGSDESNLKEFLFKVLAKSSKGTIDSGLLKGVAFMDNRKAISELQKIFSLKWNCKTYVYPNNNKNVKS